MKQSQAAMDLTRGRPLPQILRFSLPLVGTPADIFADARTYILIMFAGIPAAMLYNFASGALRAAGDSRHPFYFLAFSSVLNIFLDWLFIAPFGWGVAGAAWATVLSQFVSGLLDLYWIAGKTDLLRGSAAFQLTFPSYCKSEEEAGVCLPPLRFLQRKRFAQRFKRSVLVLLAHQQRDIKVACRDQGNLHPGAGQRPQRAGGHAAACDHLFTEQVDLAVTA